MAQQPGGELAPAVPTKRTMLRFRQIKTLQKFASVHADVHNHFSLERQLTE